MAKKALVIMLLPDCVFGVNATIEGENVSVDTSKYIAEELPPVATWSQVIQQKLGEFITHCIRKHPGAAEIKMTSKLNSEYLRYAVMNEDFDFFLLDFTVTAA